MSRRLNGSANMKCKSDFQIILCVLTNRYDNGEEEE